MIIRSKTLEQWLKANFDVDYLREIVTHGCVNGFPELTYYTDTAKLYAKMLAAASSSRT